MKVTRSVAALDPLGVIVGAEVVPGNRADDGLYLPMIQRLQASLAEQGLLYIGDSKTLAPARSAGLGALATRAYVQATHNTYLMPLAQVGRVRRPSRAANS